MIGIFLDWTLLAEFDSATHPTDYCGQDIGKGMQHPVFADTLEEHAEFPMGINRAKIIHHLLQQ